MRPIRFWGAKPGASTLVNEPGAPSSERYRPLPGDWMLPSGLRCAPPRQPTAARTAPPGAFAVDVAEGANALEAVGAEGAVAGDGDDRALAVLGVLRDDPARPDHLRRQPVADRRPRLAEVVGGPDTAVGDRGDQAVVLG